MYFLCKTSLSPAYVHRIAVSMFVDILIGLTNTVSVSEARIQITLPILRRGALSDSETRYLVYAHIPETWFILADGNWAVTFCKIFELKYCKWHILFHKNTKLFKRQAWVPCAFIKIKYLNNAPKLTVIYHLACRRKSNWGWLIAPVKTIILIGL